MSGGGAVAGPVNHARGSTRTLENDRVDPTRSFSRKPANTGGAVTWAMFRSSGRRWPGRGWLVAAVLAGPVALVFLVLGTAELRYQRQDVLRRMEETLEVVARTASVETDVTAVVAEGNGYVLDRADETARHLSNAEQRLADDLAQLRSITADNPAQRDAVARVSDLTTQRIEFLHKIIESVKAGDERQAMAMIRSGGGRALTDQVLATLAAIKAEEHRQLVVRDEAALQADRWTFAGMLTCGLLVALSSLSMVTLLAGRARERAHWARLEESEARFRSTFEQAAVGVAHVTPDGHWTRVNGRFCEMLGYTEGELLGGTFQDITYPEDLPVSVDGTRTLLAGETPTIRLEQRYVRKDGTVFWGNLTVSLLRDAAGAPQYFISVVEDISARKRVEAALRGLNQVLEAKVAERTAALAASQARHQTYLKHLADGFSAIRVEPDGRLIYEEVNSARLEMIELREDIIGRELRDVLPPVVWQQAEPHFRRCIAEGEPVRYGRRHVSGGGQRELRVTIAPVRDAPDAQHPEGRVALLLVSTRDVTNEVELEARVRQMQRMDAMGQLTAGIAHDFNNLLQAVIGGLDMLGEQGGLDDDARECLEIAESAARRGADLVRRLLAFARKQVLEPTLIEPPSVLADLRPLLARMLGDRITLVVRAEDTGCRVLADRAQLEDCLLNLALNARDAMPDGGVLELSAEAVELAAEHPALPAVEYVRFAVSDHGAGMAPETLARALEPFFTTKPLGKGTGLGLSMVQGFARQSGGDVQIDSALGRGTTVSLLLPLAARRRDAGFNAPTGADERPRVLVVDDQEVVRRTLSLFLGKAGFEVFAADSGPAALELLRAGERCDVLVTDQSMPSMTGCELIEEVNSLRPALPTILITAYEQMEGLEQLRGRISVLRKPFDRAAFVRQVEALIGPAANSVREAAPAPSAELPAPASARVVQLRPPNA
jgi:PAS domain S-box-containing protein